MHSLPQEIEKAIRKIPGSQQGDNLHVQSVQHLSGGSINTACKVSFSSGSSCFVKYNLDGCYPGMFVAESEGLGLLHSTGTVSIPGILGHGVAGGYSYLVLEMVEAGEPKTDYFAVLGDQLANLHKVTDDHFGLDHDNYIGSLAQQNDRKKSFGDFFAEMRLLPLAKKAFDSGLLDADHMDQVDSVCNRIGELIPEEPPALLHGDLWSGNRITGPDGGPWLIDPAVYFGHRETDIAMTQLFGGFDTAFYESYNETNPLTAGWEERLDLHNLYPLLVHLNLFGAGYLHQIAQILRRFH